MATQNEIINWLKEAHEMKDVTHLLIVCDTLDYNDYPVYVHTYETVREVYRQYHGENMQKVMEAYSLNKPGESPERFSSTMILKPVKLNSLIHKASAFAMEAHQGQYRKDGKTPYIFHPAAVAALLTKAGINDEETLAVGLLHDTLEDCAEKGVNYSILKQEFGSTIADNVRTLTRDCSKKEYNERIVNANNVVQIVKIADIVHNCQSLEDTLPYRVVYNKIRDCQDFYLCLSQRVSPYLHRIMWEAISPWIEESRCAP